MEALLWETINVTRRDLLARADNTLCCHTFAQLDFHGDGLGTVKQETTSPLQSETADRHRGEGTRTHVLRGGRERRR